MAKAFSLLAGASPAVHGLPDRRGVIEAKFTSQKADLLRKAALRVEDLRFLFRTAKDMHLIPLKSQGYAAERLQEIGRQLGGWRRKVEGRS